jgi:hypothetical protein
VTGNIQQAHQAWLWASKLADNWQFVLVDATSPTHRHIGDFSDLKDFANKLKQQHGGGAPRCHCH